jgi:UDP-glucose 4-epimerase
LTGGTGFIGSHTAIELAGRGHHIILLDNLCNSSIDVVDRIRQITGKNVAFYLADCCDRSQLMTIFKQEPIDAVFHFAGLKSVGESVRDPLKYYHVDLDSTIALSEAMQAFDVRRLIFSSSATVYGNPETLPLTEESRTGEGITNPYGRTKHMIEQILQDVARADNNFKVSVLRYFNPIGAHPSGLIGERPAGTPNNLMPYLLKVASGELPHVQVFGDDYETPDGSGVRDYIHVSDLARGHIAALDRMEKSKSNYDVYNLGTGSGVSVFELITALEKVTGKLIPYRIAPRRDGDVAECYADITKAREVLNWQPAMTIMDACEDAWRWQQHSMGSVLPIGGLSSQTWEGDDGFTQRESLNAAA